jgi:hypothetical protein
MVPAWATQKQGAGRCCQVGGGRLSGERGGHACSPRRARRGRPARPRRRSPHSTSSCTPCCRHHRRRRRRRPRLRPHPQIRCTRSLSPRPKPSNRPGVQPTPLWRRPHAPTHAHTRSQGWRGAHDSGIEGCKGCEQGGGAACVRYGVWRRALTGLICERTGVHLANASAADSSQSTQLGASRAPTHHSTPQRPHHLLVRLAAEHQLVAHLLLGDLHVERRHRCPQSCGRAASPPTAYGASACWLLLATSTRCRCVDQALPPACCCCLCCHMLRSSSMTAVASRCSLSRA